ncbi:MAG: hypothetical protein A3J07_02730 [Candidatus Doudnabacteria bacterium RIFCSPLOWO2_02_FULL_49_13]|uniref:HAD family hydrolase n=1 Tax=Candidatus Doudnabacteria bacterium RIFCSPHIGHO2_12_FULL_48_16 TaxID=1817838 RepID=A0A1F5PKY7_9BACT|nr:MAG: hypothetical protein A3B77_01375 [Candidatus Doudnabacteria bacterium RIFCSPHIGHO2_02_FULL_49_24]OGE88124.1 MAG: hypothetical protein A2760_00950 [Candidatus Doudnabacteria bacterium RIFCSPHIGHO2_01_FULL_50_67]OGE90593.1 MAG: hypothetical protein A3E29_02245 [Candidatus Doudnabacteria bacterium RIFCSPHIGHO2_12_FULL_48_16]OGE96483.1 MAG: hypothetical protein A2990_04350 [Candidatus Doudnabacteria bacterium RIFCSPLOWO2_01_FULL_49_40]OGF02985.1 MAG: hypothetical protein A3J07_02730 [Candid
MTKDKIKLVAFDWNGTIFADTNLVVRAMSHTLVKFRLKPTNLKELQHKMVVPFKLYWLAMGMKLKDFERNVLTIRKTYFTYYEPREGLCRTRAGSREILDWLETQKINKVIFSNHMESHIRKQLKRLEIDSFKDILGFTTVEDTSLMHKRGKESQLEEYVIKNRLKPNEVLVVGDTTEEIEIGKKFGYVTVALSGGNSSTRRLKATKPDHLIHHLKKLKNIIQDHGRTAAKN